MLDIGWSELLVIAVVAIIFVGPRDLIPMLRTFGQYAAKLKKMAGEFQSQFNDALREADLDDIQKTVSDVRKMKPLNALKDQFESEMGEIGTLAADIKPDGTAKTEANTGAAEKLPKAGSKPAASAKSPATKRAARKTAVPKAPAAKAPARKTPAKKSAARTGARKTSASKTSASKASAGKGGADKASGGTSVRESAAGKDKSGAAGGKA